MRAAWLCGFRGGSITDFAHCPPARESSNAPPSEYLKRMYFDTITHSPEALRYVIERVGADRLALGTDYPFAVADFDPVGTVDAIPDLTEDERETIAGGAAAALLRLA